MKDYFQRGDIYTVEVKLSSKCIMGCKYCYASCTETTTNHISSEVLKQLIDDCVEVGVKQINWGGGEPLERKEWIEILEYSKDAGLRNLMMTNGMFLNDDETILKIHDLVDMISIHIDSSDLQIWRDLHGGDDHIKYLHQLQGLDKLMQSGYSRDNMALYMTLTKPLFENGDYKKTIDWAYDDLGLSAIMFPYRSFGFAEDQKDLNPSNKQMCDAYKYRNSKDGINSGPGFGSKFYCGTSCHIDSNGAVMACSMVYPTYVGNINKIRFKEIYELGKDTLTYKSLHDPSNIDGVCSSCENNHFCWGCRAASELIAGGFHKGDPICWMNEGLESKFKDI